MALRSILLILAILFAPSVLAHGDGGSTIASGLLHPLVGADHLAFLVGAGLWLASTRRAAVVGAGAIAAGLCTGAVLGLLMAPGNGVEWLLALSVMAAGFGLVTALRAPAAATAMTIAGLSVLHGWVHAAEIPGAAAPLSWWAGVLTASLSLYGLGLMAGRVLGRDGPAPLRISGAVGIMGGVALLLAV
jgi:urease accessory protein